MGWTVVKWAVVTAEPSNWGSCSYHGPLASWGLFYREVLGFIELDYREVGHSIAAGPIELSCCVFGRTH